MILPYDEWARRKSTPRHQLLLWIVTVRLLLACTGTALAVAAGGALAAHPGDNGLIAYVASDSALGRSGWITTVRPDGTRARRVGRGSDPAWSADGRRLYFRTSRGGVGTLVTTTSTGRDLRLLTCDVCETPSGARQDPGYVDPEPSPDGDLVAARRIDSVVVIDVSTGTDGDTTLASEVGLVEDCGAGCLSASSPSWSPDGRHIAFVQGDGEGDGGVVAGRVCVVAATGGTPRCLTAGPGDTVPDWSPDGRWVAFERSVGCAGGSCRGAVFVVRANGTGLRRVLSDASQPAWSPDGRRLAIVRLARPGSCSDPICRRGIATVKLDGTGLRTITRGTRHVFPDWQPIP
jgi:Tol biopolymer transport system component